jgi:pimeloyl-ACP methyl ester carboxylesterase
MEKVLMTIVGSDVAFWLVSKFARNLVIRTVLATPPGVVRAASKDEQARVERTLRNILPISERSGGILNDARISHSLTREELDKIRAPTLVLSVRDDLYGTFASAEYVAKEIPGAKFVGYDVGGHLWVGHHEQIISEVAAFLRAI